MIYDAEPQIRIYYVHVNAHVKNHIQYYLIHTEL